MRAHGPRRLQAGCLGISCLVVALLAMLPQEALAQCQAAEAGRLPFGAHQVPCSREPAIRASSASTPHEGPILRETALQSYARADTTPQRFDRGFDRAASINWPERQQELAHLESARVSAINRFSTGGSDAGASESSPLNRSLDAVPWADSRDWIHNPPQILKELKNYRRQGVPIIRLVNTAQTVVAFGVSNHGKPGLYFTRKLPF